MKGWLENLSPTWQSLTAIGSAILFGAFIMGMTYKFSQLPELVHENQEDIQRLSTRVERVEIRQGDILESIKFSNCMAVADAKGEPWQVCKNDPTQYLRDNQ